MGKLWLFKVFLDDGVDVINPWLAALPLMVQERFRALLSYMEITQLWKGEYFKALREHRNLYEIRLTGSIQYRLLGCYGPNPREFTLLIGTTKVANRKGKTRITTWTPRNALAIASQRRDSVLSDWRKYTDDYY
jgi:hypothetical protein